MSILAQQFMRALIQQLRRSKLPGLVCLLWLAAVATPARAQEFDEMGRWVNGFTESWWIEADAYTRPEVDAAIARWMRIGDDIKATPDDEWVGGYHSGGDTHGTFLRWSPQSGYVMFAVNKCMATVTNVDFGRVEFSPEVVRFVSERQSGKAHAHGDAQEEHSHSRLPDIGKLVPVKWRGIRFLLSPRDVAEFCDYAAGLGRYTDAETRMRGDSPVVMSFGRGYREREEVSEELPVVPPEYARLVKRPIETEVIAVGPKRTKRRHHYDNNYYYEAVRTLRFGAGSLDGLKRGMTLRLTESEHDDWIKITSVGKRSSTGRLVRVLDDDMRETYKDWEKDRISEFPEVKVGWRLTTSPRW